MANWEGVKGAAGYRLDVSTSSSFSSYVSGYQNLEVGNVTSRTVSGLSPGVTYYYRVRAHNALGTSGNSEITAAKTMSGSGLVINATFDSSITSNANSAAIESMINQSIAIYESLFSDPITVSILFRYSTSAPDGSPLGSNTLAESEYVIYSTPWNTYISALQADAKTGNDSTANASLPASPLSTNIIPSSAGGRAVGLNTPPAMFANGAVGSGGPYDGIVTLNSAQAFQFTRPPHSNNFDALRSTEHEIDEVLGLGSRLGQSGNDLRPQDLFSWSGFHSRNLSSTGTRYFSIDSGSTNIVNFNQNSNGDFGDWLSASCPQANPYVQNAFSCPGQSSDVMDNSPEGINLDVIGYDLASSPSAPTANPATNITSSGFTANWNGVIGAGGYRLDVSTSGSFSSYVSGYQDLNVGNATSQSVSGLSANTTYYYRVRAYNGSGTSDNSNLITVTTTGFSTPTPTPSSTPTPTPTPNPNPTYTILVSGSPSTGGAVSGGGTYPSGSTVTVTATANSGFNFANWAKNGTIVGTSPSYIFTATSDVTLVANFVAIPTVSLSAFPTKIGKGASATFAISATTVNSSRPTVVNYSMSGTAVLGSDYTLSGTPGQITIPPGAFSGSVGLQVVTSKTGRGEKATMTLNAGAGYNLAAPARRHRHRHANQATVVIQNR